MTEGGGCKDVLVFTDDHAWELNMNEASCTSHNLTWGDSSIEKNTMTLVQLHTHFPSEHMIDGKYADAELHMVHKHYNDTTMDNAAVLGVLLVVDKDLVQKDSPFQKYWEAIDAQADAMSNAGQWGNRDYSYSTRYSAEWQFLGLSGEDKVNAYSEFLPKDKTLWHYIGSLTTFPCTNGVNWFVYQTPVSITALDLENLKSAVSNERHTLTETVQGTVFDIFTPYRTNRPIQPQLDRDVWRIPGNFSSS